MVSTPETSALHAADRHAIQSPAGPTAQAGGRVKWLPAGCPYLSARPLEPRSTASTLDYLLRPSPLPIRLWSHRCQPHCKPIDPGDPDSANREQARVACREAVPILPLSGLVPFRKDLGHTTCPTNCSPATLERGGRTAWRTHGLHRGRSRQ